MDPFLRGLDSDHTNNLFRSHTETVVYGISSLLNFFSLSIIASVLFLLASRGQMKSLKDAMASVITKSTALSKILPVFFHDVETERMLYLYETEYVTP